MFRGPEMILFHCTFASLKAQNSETLEVETGEYQLRNERRLFQAYVAHLPCSVTQWLSNCRTYMC